MILDHKLLVQENVEFFSHVNNQRHDKYSNYKIIFNTDYDRICWNTLNVYIVLYSWLFQHIHKTLFDTFLVLFPCGLGYNAISLYLGRCLSNHNLCISAWEPDAFLSCVYTLPDILKFCTHIGHILLPDHSAISAQSVYTFQI